MLKFGIEYSLYIFDEYSTQFGYNGIYDSVVQTLWFVFADKTKQYSKRIWLVSAEPSTIYGGSNSSACSPKVLICWQ